MGIAVKDLTTMIPGDPGSLAELDTQLSTNN